MVRASGSSSTSRTRRGVLREAAYSVRSGITASFRGTEIYPLRWLKSKPEGGAAGRGVGADQIASAGASQRAGDGQAQPGAVVPRGERREEAIAQALRDAGAVVLHQQ